jgi:hypothetical protein
MSTTTKTTLGAAIPFTGQGKCFITPPATVAIPVTGITNDIVQALPFKAGWLIQGVILKSVTAGAGSTITLQCGITGGTVDGFIAAFDGKAAGPFKSTPSSTYPAAGGYLAAADGTVDILLDSISAMATGPVFTAQMIVVDTNA